MTEAITMIQTRRSATGSGLLHPHHSVLKQIKPYSSDSQALEASTCRYTPFCSVLCIKRWLRLHRKRSLEHELFCLDAYNTWSTLYDGPKVSCCSYVIIVRTLMQLLDHYILTSMMCINWSWHTAVDSCLPLQCCIQECVGVQWHSQVGRHLATIHI